MSSTYHTTEGIIIKKMPYNEHDFLVRILTKDFGKIDLRARGARNFNSKLNSHLDFLDNINFSFVKNGDRIPTVIGSEKISSNHLCFTSLKNLQEAANAALAIDLLIPYEVKDELLFSLSKNFFQSWETGAGLFLKKVITHEGYGTVYFLPKDVQDFIISKWPVLKS